LCVGLGKKNQVAPYSNIEAYREEPNKKFMFLDDSGLMSRDLQFVLKICIRKGRNIGLLSCNM
jgi:hypothetical protein